MIWALGCLTRHMSHHKCSQEKSYENKTNLKTMFLVNYCVHHCKTSLFETGILISMSEEKNAVINVGKYHFI